MNILHKIVDYKRGELERRKKIVPLSQLPSPPISSPMADSFLKTVSRHEKFHFICEIKKASPSKGVITKDFNPTTQARYYETAGASAISVVTDEHFFQGKLSYLSDIRETVKLPLLRKDFIFDRYQIYETAAAGANIILLIARILEREEIRNFTSLSNELGMDVLLELYEEEDINKIPANQSLILGINNRNLADFSVNFGKSFHMKEKLPAGLPVVSESGIYTAADCQMLAEHGFHGALIGEALMRSKNPVKYLQELQQGVDHVYPS